MWVCVCARFPVRYLGQGAGPEARSFQGFGFPRGPFPSFALPWGQYWKDLALPGLADKQMNVPGDWVGGVAGPDPYRLGHVGRRGVRSRPLSGTPSAGYFRRHLTAPAWDARLSSATDGPVAARMCWWRWWSRGEPGSEAMAQERQLSPSVSVLHVQRGAPLTLAHRRGECMAHVFCCY